MNDQTLRSRCLHGLQKVSARCGLLPKSYWISHSGLTEPGGAPSAAGRVSSTRQRLIDGNMVVVKTINHDCIDNFSAFKNVRPPFFPEHPLSTQFSVRVYAETVYQRGHVEATATSKCNQFPRVRFRLPSFLPCVPLDAQREFVRVLARAPRCR